MVSEEVQAAIDDGMAVQRARMHEALARGMPRVGWKVALNDPAVQKRMGIEGSLVGWLNGQAVYPSGATYIEKPGMTLRVEPEVAIRLSRDVAAEASLEDARRAIVSLAPALEIVNPGNAARDLRGLIEGDILHEATILGQEVLQHDAEAPASGLVPAGFPSTKIDDGEAHLPLEGRVPADFASVVLEVAAFLGRYGEPLRAGDRIIAGSYCNPIDIEPGNRVTADFGPLGTVELLVG